MPVEFITARHISAGDGGPVGGVGRVVLRSMTIVLTAWSLQRLPLGQRLKD
jgi:hypothetical protein